MGQTCYCHHVNLAHLHSQLLHDTKVEGRGQIWTCAECEDHPSQQLYSKMEAIAEPMQNPINRQAVRTCVKSIKKQGKSPQRHAIARMHVGFPTYEDLKGVVEKTFTASASFLPLRVEFWTKRGADAEKIISSRSDFLAHSDVQLARSLAKSSSFDELQLGTAYSEGCKQAIIATDEARWSDGIFEVVCFEPEFQDSRVILEKWTESEFQIKWGKRTVGCTSIGKFHTEGTSLKQQLFEDAATLFMDFLSAELSNKWMHRGL